MNQIHDIISRNIKKDRRDGLITLDLSSSNVSLYLGEIPKEIFEYKDLQFLKIKNQRIREIPKDICKLQNLQKLDLSRNRINSLPEWIGEIEQLNYLDLGDNSLNKFPVELFELPSLLHLHLIGNRIKEIPYDIYRLSKLTTLRASRIFQIPESIISLKLLKELVVMSSNFNDSFIYISDLEGLETLGLNANNLIDIPDWFENLRNLVKINLTSNRFTSLPKFITSLQQLRELILSNNPLDDLPTDFINLKNLEILRLDNCSFGHIPDVIYEIPTITKISISNNTHNFKPIANCSNQIKDISHKILNLPNLKKLSVQNNPINVPPPEIVEKGTEAIKNYFKQSEEQGIENLYEAKLLIVGEGGAGKTSLANKIVDVNYQLQEEDSTKGIEVIKWEFPLEGGKKFRVNIWDFGGQEIYHQTHQFFLTKRSLYALVADNRKEDTDFYYWLSVVELLSENSPLLIIKNEKQNRQRDIGEKQLRGQFTNLKETLATNLENNRGLEEILRKVKHYICELPHIGTPLPKIWVKVRTHLEKDPRNHITLEEYLSICQTYGFNSKEDELQLSGYLHDLGVCLHFQKDPLLKKTVILKPKWGTNAVYKVLDNENIVANLGKFSQTDLSKIWSELEYSEMQDELLQLMINFKLCYKISGSAYYIAPQLLSENQSEYEWDEEDNLILRYEYEFMPKGIINQLVVALHKLILDQRYVWRSGVLLEKNETLAEVIEHYGKKEIKMRFVGKHKRDLMTIVTHEIDKLHDSYKSLKFNRLIPCNCVKCKGSQSPHFYEHKILQKFIEDHQEYIQCLKSYKMVIVRELIDDLYNKKTSTIKNKRDRIFISYSRYDKAWLDKLKIMLKPIIRENQISVWDDTQIKTGAKWKEEIVNALNTTKIAVLLVSPDFLASDFIAEQELPPLLEAAEKEGVVIFWIAVSHSLFSETSINEFNCVNDPKFPLDSLSPAKLNQAMVEISKKLMDISNDL